MDMNPWINAVGVAQALKMLAADMGDEEKIARRLRDARWRQNEAESRALAARIGITKAPDKGRFMLQHGLKIAVHL